MLNVKKSDGATSKAGHTVQKGSKGCLELFGFRNDNGTFGVRFVDKGNYGKDRWWADFGDMTEAELCEVINSLNDLLDGKIITTRFDELEQEVVTEMAGLVQGTPVESEVPAPV